MGGLGPGYEQAIQILAFELIRALLAASWVTPNPYPTDQAGKEKVRAAWDAICNPVIEKLDGEGFTGAQVGAAYNLAACVLNQGWRAAINKLPLERRIMVSRTFPQAPAPPASSSPGG
jgi:hypothetical protein